MDGVGLRFDILLTTTAMKGPSTETIFAISGWKKVASSRIFQRNRTVSIHSLGLSKLHCLYEGEITNKVELLYKYENEEMPVWYDSVCRLVQQLLNFRLLWKR